MRDFNYPLDPAETLTIRRIFSFDRVRNKGKAVYSVNHELMPFLLVNGWELVRWPHGSSLWGHMRAPMQAESFTFHIAIPNDQAIMRVAGEMLLDAQGRRPGPKDPASISGQIERFSVSFGMGWLYDQIHAPFRQGGWRSSGACDPPHLCVGQHGLWNVRLDWLNGVDQPPTWNREEYFSALVPGLSFRGELFSDLDAIHAAELKRYEEGIARQQID